MDGHQVVRIVAASVIMLSGLGVMYLELPDQMNLNGNRAARRMLAGSCFLVSTYLIILDLQLLTNPYTTGLTSLDIISTATFLMANFFTHIINPHAFKPLHYFLQLASVIIILLVTIMVIFLSNAILIKYIYLLFVCGYAIQLLVLTRIFRKEFTFFLHKVKSGSNPLQLNPKWIKRMFLYAPCHGLAALVFLYFQTHKAASSVFTVIFTQFFIVVSINYIRHVYLLKSTSTISINTTRKPYKNLSEALDCWEKSKGFLKQGITLTDVANQIGTNRTYLSNHINTEKRKHFNGWVNELRIAEAKELLINRKDLTIDQVSEMMGYTEQSNFTHHFTHLTGTSPHVWRIKG